MNPQEPAQPTPLAPQPAPPLVQPTQPPQPPVEQPEQTFPSEPDGNALSVTQPGERTLCTIRRHPIGIFGVYVMTGTLLVVMAVLAFVAAPRVFTSVSNSQVMLFGALLFLIVAAACMAFSLISTRVYWGNSWVLTSDSLTQIAQSSLFDRQSSQLSLGNLEDVSAEQNGVLAHMFNYGLLKVETAGERSKFIFQYCPNPNYYAQQVLAAREAFEQGRKGEDLQRPYRAEDSYQAAPTS